MSELPSYSRGGSQHDRGGLELTVMRFVKRLHITLRWYAKYLCHGDPPIILFQHFSENMDPEEIVLSHKQYILVFNRRSQKFMYVCYLHGLLKNLPLLNFLFFVILVIDK